VPLPLFEGLPFGPVHWKHGPDRFPLAPQKRCLDHISNPCRVVHAVVTDVLHAACRSQSTRSELDEIDLIKHFTRAARLTSLLMALPHEPQRFPEQGTWALAPDSGGALGVAAREELVVRRQVRAGGGRGRRGGGFARGVVVRGVHDALAVEQRAGELYLERADAGCALSVAAREELVVRRKVRALRGRGRARGGLARGGVVRGAIRGEEGAGEFCLG